MPQGGAMLRISRHVKLLAILGLLDALLIAACADTNSPVSPDPGQPAVGVMPSIGMTYWSRPM